MACTSEAACCSNAAAAPTMACWLSPAIFSLIRACRASASFQVSAAAAALASRRAATLSSSPAERGRRFAQSRRAWRAGRPPALRSRVDARPAPAARDRRQWPWWLRSGSTGRRAAAARAGDGRVQRRRFARDAGHRHLHRRLDRRAGRACTVGDALRQRLLDGFGQPAVCSVCAVMERGLARGQPGGHGLVLLLDRRHHGLEPVDQRGHDVRLPLHQPERLFALVRTRERAQRGGDAGIERQRGLDPLAAAQRGKQAQHGRRGHAGDRCAERESQALDGRGQRRADGVEIRRAFERDTGAAQRRHHAQERAEHAQQYQQADEIRGQRRAGSAVRSPSMRRRAALRRLGCSGSSHAARLAGEPDSPATASASVEVACR